MAAAERERRSEQLTATALPIVQSLYDRARHKNVECEERQSRVDRVLPGLKTQSCARYPYNGTVGTWGRVNTFFLEEARWDALGPDDQELLTTFFAEATLIRQIIVGELINSNSLPGYPSLTIDHTVWEY